MSLFAEIPSEKDRSELEPVGNQPTQPIALAYSVDERAEWRELLKVAAKDMYGENWKESNYSDIFLELLRKNYG